MYWNPIQCILYLTCIGTHVYRVHSKPQIFMISVYRIVTLNKGLSSKRATEHGATVSLATPRALDASLSQGYSQHYVAGTHFIHLGGERQCGVQFLV